MFKRHSLILLFVFAFFIRLISLNQSLWLDEGVTAVILHQYSPTEILRIFSPNDFHPPLYYLLLKFWMLVFGSSEISLRMPSVFLSLVAGWFVYKIGSTVKNKETGYWSAAFFLLNPLVIYYSQEARMYLLAVALVSANLSFFIQLLNRKSRALEIYFCSTLILSLFTFYGTVFYFGAVGLYCLITKRWRLALITFTSSVTSILCLLPLLTQQFANSRESLQLVKNWSSVLGTASLKNLVLIPLKFTSGRLSFEPKWLYYLLGGGWMLFTLDIASWGARKHRMLGFIFITPLILGLLFSTFSPLLQYFRFLYLLVPLSVLLALGTDRVKIFRPIFLVGLTTWSLTYLLLPQFHREDWKSLAQEVLPQESQLYIISSSSEPLRYYLPDLRYTALQELSTKPPTQPTIAVIPYTAEIHGLPYRDLLTGYNYQQTSETSVRGLSIQTWKQVGK